MTALMRKRTDFVQGVLINETEKMKDLQTTLNSRESVLALLRRQLVAKTEVEESLKRQYEVGGRQCHECLCLCATCAVMVFILRRDQMYWPTWLHLARRRHNKR